MTIDRGGRGIFFSEVVTVAHVSTSKHIKLIGLQEKKREIINGTETSEKQNMKESIPNKSGSNTHCTMEQSAYQKKEQKEGRVKEYVYGIKCLH